jgi:hypothetical protein
MKNGAAAVENSLVVPQKVKNLYFNCIVKEVIRKLRMGEVSANPRYDKRLIFRVYKEYFQLINGQSSC